MPMYVLVLGLLAGAAAWMLGEAIYGQFDPELSLEASLNNTQIAMQELADTRTAAVLYGILAGLVGFCLGLGGGLARSNVRWAVIAGVVGAVVGGLGAALTSLGLVPVHHARYNPDSQDLLFPMMIHGAIWGMAGLAGGLALGLGVGAPRALPTAIVGGVVGALLATALYEVVGAVAFPLASTVEPMSTSAGARLLACMVVALGTSLGALAGLQPRRSIAPATSTATA
jgi:hypothetical protein